MDQGCNRIVALSLMLCLLATGRLAAQTTGQLLSVQGIVERKTPHQRPIAIQSFDQFKEGDQVVVREKSAATLVFYESGARFALAAGSVVKIVHAQMQSLSGPPPRALAGISKRLLKKVSTPVTELGPKSAGVMLRVMEDPEIGPRHPSPLGAVRTTSVILHWEGKFDQADGSGQAGQRIEIKDGKTGKTVIMKDLELTARECSVDQNTLQPGHWYPWTVTAAGKGIGVRRCSATFYVLSEEEAAEISAIEKDVEKTNTNDSTLKLLMAQAYEKFGLVADALSDYEAASRLSPSDMAIQKAITRLRKQTNDAE